MDRVDKKIRSKIMGSVRQRGTGPELQIRKALHRLGFRFRLNDKKLPGSPDLVFRKYKTVIFVHGCFWHRHGCKRTTTPATNREFWESKFKANIDRDERKLRDLENLGWRVLTVWECEIKNDLNSGLLDKISDFLNKKFNSNYD